MKKKKEESVRVYYARGVDGTKTISPQSPKKRKDEEKE